MGPGPIFPQLFQCHREERSDAAISSYKDEIATLPSVARNDIVKIYTAFTLETNLNISCNLGTSSF